MNEHPIFIFIDPGTSMVKFGMNYAGLTETDEVESYFYPQPGVYPGKESYTLVEPSSFAGLVGMPVKDVEPDNITREANFYTTPKFPQAIFYAIATMLDKYDLPEYVSLWLGIALPHAHIGKAETIRQKLQKTWNIGKADQMIRQVTIERVIVETQSKAVALDQVFQWKQNGKGLVLDSERGKRLLRNGAMYVFLSGSNSLEQGLLTGRFDQFVSESKFTGSFDLLPQLQQKAFDLTSENLSQYELMYQALKNGRITLERQLYNFETINRQLLTQYFESQDINRAVQMFLRTYKVRPYTAILAGGNVVLGRETLQTVYQKKFQQILIARDDRDVAEPVYAVRRGLEKDMVFEWEKSKN